MPEIFTIFDIWAKNGSGKLRFSGLWGFNGGWRFEIPIRRAKRILWGIDGGSFKTTSPKKACESC